MGMCKWFFRDATKIQNGRQMSTLKFFVGAKTKTFSRQLFKFYYRIPHDMEMCRWLFQGFTEIQNGRHSSTLNLFGQFFLNFNITFLATWGCACDFLKMLQKFKMAARGQPQIFLWEQKLQNFKSEIIQILLSHSPWYADVQVTFSRFYWNSKWPTLPTIWRCASDFLKVSLKFKMAAMDKLHIFLWAQ